MPSVKTTFFLWLVPILIICAGLLWLKTHPDTPSRHPQREKVAAFQYARGIQASQVVADKDLTRVQLPKTTAERLGELLTEDQKNTLAVNQKIYRDVSKGDFAMWGHFSVTDPEPRPRTQPDSAHSSLPRRSVAKTGGS